jgi:hypothetical protein
MVWLYLRRNISPPSSGSTNKPRTKPAWKQVASRALLAWLILRPWRWRRYVPPKRRLNFNGLHGVISQNIVVLITTAVRTSNPSRVLFKCLQFYKQNVLRHKTFQVLAHIIRKYMIRSGGISASWGASYASNFTRNTVVWVSNLLHQLTPLSFID